MLRTLKNTYHLGKAILANSLNGFPSRGLTVIGVTGTDGKTTTSSLIYHILQESGQKVALISTVGAYIGDKQYNTGFHVTTPSSFTLQRYIKRAKKWGAKYLVLETTSHSLDQNRVWGIGYKIGVLTNISHEHLDYHKTYLEYTKAKLKLLKRAKTVVLNLDDKSFDAVRKPLRGKEVITYSRLNPKASFNLKRFPFTTKLLGDFNQSNSLAAISVAKKLGIADKTIKLALKSFQPPPGRQEILYDKDFKVIVDFAHTPNSFLEILRDLHRMKKGRLIHVFGSAGKRDITKRPLMGRASGKYSDVIILTAEDPRNEKVEDINRMIKRGIPKNKKVLEFVDREEAIKEAIRMAKKGDIIIITGKGHEESMNLGKGEVPWSDKEAVQRSLGNS